MSEQSSEGAVSNNIQIAHPSDGFYDEEKEERLRYISVLDGGVGILVKLFEDDIQGDSSEIMGWYGVKNNILEHKAGIYDTWVYAGIKHRMCLSRCVVEKPRRDCLFARFLAQIQMANGEPKNIVEMKTRIKDALAATNEYIFNAAVEESCTKDMIGGERLFIEANKEYMTRFIESEKNLDEEKRGSNEETDGYPKIEEQETLTAIPWSVMIGSMVDEYESNECNCFGCSGSVMSGWNRYEVDSTVEPRIMGSLRVASGLAERRSEPRHPSTYIHLPDPSNVEEESDTDDEMPELVMCGGS